MAPLPRHALRRLHANKGEESVVQVTQEDHQHKVRKKEGEVLEVGVDEAGRGPLAGPVVCAACYLPEGVVVEGVMDSKQIGTEEAREETYARLVATPGVRYAVAKCEADVIDDLNILQATLAGMRLCARRLGEILANGEESDANVLVCRGTENAETQKRALSSMKLRVLVDGNKDPFAEADDPLESRAIIGGDDSVACISAASVIAKVTRDRIMNELHDRYPEYEFLKHKGYGTFAHRSLIHEFGWLNGIHRKSFNPVKTMISNNVPPRSLDKSSEGRLAPQPVDPSLSAPPPKDVSVPAETPLEDLPLAELRSRCEAAGLATVVKRDDGPPGPGRAKAVLIARLQNRHQAAPPSGQDPDPSDDRTQPRRSKRFRR